jgi:hypothetical protein
MATDAQGYYFGKAMPPAQIEAFLDGYPFWPARAREATGSLR